MKPGPPLPSTAILYDSGGFLSASFTLPSNVPFTPPTPTFIVALYSSGPIASSFSHPGMACRRRSGSRNASHTCCRDAGTWYAPSSFMPRISFARELTGRGLESYHGHGRCSLPPRVVTHTPQGRIIGHEEIAIGSLRPRAGRQHDDGVQSHGVR